MTTSVSNCKISIIGRALILVLLFCTVALYGADSPLIGHWPLDEGEGLVIKDKSGNGYHGTILRDGNNTAWTEGREGKALEFIPDRFVPVEKGCINIPIGKYDFSKGLTIEAWVKFTTADANSPKVTRFMILFNGSTGTETGFQFYYSWHALYFETSKIPEQNLIDVFAPPQFKPGVWYFLAATYDGSAVRLFVDGKELPVLALEGGKRDQEYQKPLIVSQGRNNFYIGAIPGAYGMEGIISDLKVYNAVRTPAQILEDME
ncbi:MAG: LamG domain-containing protein [Candidatus Ratteibacteria bacterium]